MDSLNLVTFVTAGDLVDSKDVSPPNYILKGLESAHVGMLLAAPEMGKSQLCFSIAIENSTSLKLLGLSVNSTMQKTLLISAEDSVSVVKEQMSEKLKALPHKIRKQARDNIVTFSARAPFVTPPDAGLADQNFTEAYISRIINLIKENDINLVVIDTVSEVIGACDEIKHDRIIKNTFQRIARESGAALLLVHHVNKAEIRGEADVSMASGAGLTTVMRLSKLILGITSGKDSKKQLNFLKANYLSKSEKQGFELCFSEGLFVNPTVANLKNAPSKQKAPTRPNPIVIERDEVEVNVEGKRAKDIIRNAF
ncbi:AAA family ATPase [Vibrio crassostreae]|uniref:AAA family ATPase n=1 Tax=Vibrio crassostreae TaxID=246167 RepID=UPI001B305780|nr:AAA family ATPase [Vibrio crassostreae]